jgi:hypothetical protein
VQFSRCIFYAVERTRLGSALRFESYTNYIPVVNGFKGSGGPLP